MEMNKMVKQAEVFNIRDQQLAEKQQLRKKKFEEIKKLDVMMEMDRLNRIKKEEMKQAGKRKLEDFGRQVIIRQIEENYIKKLKVK